MEDATSDCERPPSGSEGRRRWFPKVSDAEWNDWRWQFRNRISSLDDLARLVTVAKDELAVLTEVLRDFKMAVTPYYFSLIDPSDPNDPIRRQAVPSADEYLYRNIGDDDPLHEEALSPVPGLTHRYPDRVLMVVTNVCAMYCRHCTRKRIMCESAASEADIDRMIAYVAATRTVRDVIVSGGDPFTMATERIERILRRLRAIPHVEVIRVGTRTPCTLPQRIDNALCDMLQKYHPIWVNVQFNHPKECTPEAAAACDRLLRAGIPVNNQSVLLKGVNDDPRTMKELIHGLMRMRVRPYYLFQCDPVRGAEHFRTPVARGIEIVGALRGYTSGLAVPTYVIDAPGGGGKVPIGPQYLLCSDPKEGRTILRGYDGRIFEYFDPQSLSGAALAGVASEEAAQTGAGQASAAGVAAEKSDAGSAADVGRAKPRKAAATKACR